MFDDLSPLSSLPGGFTRVPLQTSGIKPARPSQSPPNKPSYLPKSRTTGCTLTPTLCSMDMIRSSSSFEVSNLELPPHAPMLNPVSVHFQSKSHSVKMSPGSLSVHWQLLPNRTLFPLYSDQGQEMSGDEQDGFSLFQQPLKVARVTSDDHKTITSMTIQPMSITEPTGSQPTGFASLGLDPWLVNTLSSLSMTKPTAVQSACIPIILSLQKDVIGVAQTGSGKTAAFALPLLNLLHKDPYGPFAVILTPTRELAVQIDEQFRVFGKEVLVKTVLVIGGVDQVEQAGALIRRPHFVIGTPGRLADLLASSEDVRGVFKRCRFLVLDEADRLLEGGNNFLPDLDTIFDYCYRRDTRLLLFTATLTDTVSNFDRLNPERLFTFTANTTYGTADTVTQRYLFIPSKVKDCYLYHLLSTTGKSGLANSTVIVFVGKCITAELLTLSLRQLQVKGGVVSLHSRHPQRVRLQALRLFKNGSARVLIATDVAARGLDIPQVHTVLNYDLPASTRDYVHRIGRTGRAGLPGNALCFVSELDIELVQAIEAKTGKQLQEAPVDDEDVVLESLNKCSDARQWASMRLREIGFHDKRK